ncbi:MAG: DUF983 domain-containing protein [Bacteroidia bacterium]|nr:DUF983 domain-containing protein [Bacteroidia bacterium]
MIKRGSKIYSIIHLKCPRCHEGDLFTVKNAYRLKHVDKMPDYCPKCGEDFQREVGFYYGAMMISHASTTVIAVINHIIVFSIYGWELAPNLISLVVVIVGLFPLVFRSSRAIWINMFSKFDPLALQNKIERQKI